MVEVDVKARGTRRTSRKMRWWQRTKRHGLRRDTGVKGRERERERGSARKKMDEEEEEKEEEEEDEEEENEEEEGG